MQRRSFASRLRCQCRKSAGGDTRGDSRWSPSCPPLPPGLSLVVVTPLHQSVAMADSGLLASALARAARDDYPAWLAQAGATGGCSRPVRLHGQVRHIDPATGEILRTLSTADAPDGDLHRVRGPPRLGLPGLRRDLPGRHLPADPRRTGGRQGRAGIGRGPPVRVRHLYRALLRPRARPHHRPRRAGTALPTPSQTHRVPARPVPVLPSPPQRDRHLPGPATLPGLLRLRRRRRLERARARTVAAHHHRAAPPPGQARPRSRHQGQTLVCQGG
jgi:replication initiator protein RepSA